MKPTGKEQWTENNDANLFSKSACRPCRRLHHHRTSSAQTRCVLFLKFNHSLDVPIPSGNHVTWICPLQTRYFEDPRLFSCPIAWLTFEFGSLLGDSFGGGNLHIQIRLLQSTMTKSRFTGVMLNWYAWENVQSYSFVVVGTWRC